MTQDLKYSHNLNIMIIDESFSPFENKILMQSIYDEFVNKTIIKEGIIFNRKYEIHLHWEKINIQNKFIGDLFIRSPYSDKVLYETTKKILNEIENNLKKETENKNWKIAFYISKLLENMDTEVIIN